MSLNAPVSGALGLPTDMVPPPVMHYLAHTECGISIRELARQAGCYASTISRQVRRIETCRDDALFDSGLRRLGPRFPAQDHAFVRHIDRVLGKRPRSKKDISSMVSPKSNPSASSEKEILRRDMLRVLGRLCEKGALLAVAADLENAVVVRDGPQAQGLRTAVVARQLAEVLALNEWIVVQVQGRVTRYAITASGRAAYHSLSTEAGEVGDLPDFEAETPAAPGMAEARVAFAGKEACEIRAEQGQSRRARYSAVESPLNALARRRDKDGKPFLSAAEVNAGERLREDFELSQMGPNVTQNWDRFLTGAGSKGRAPDANIGRGPEAARARVSAALATLGPGLSDVVMQCCCHLDGLETVEKRLGWSARSAKVVLRIALGQLDRHFEKNGGPGGGLIG